MFGVFENTHSLIDLTHTIQNGMPVFSGDDPVKLYQTRYLHNDKHNNYHLEINMHSGTHIDGPMHLTTSPVYISELSPEGFIGPGCILDVRQDVRQDMQQDVQPSENAQRQPTVIPMREAYADMVAQGSIVLMYTGHDKHYGNNSYFTNYPILSQELCEFFVSKKVKLLGMDTPSPDRYPFIAHHLLLSNGIFIIENLTNLDRLLSISAFEIIALPLKINADSSLARVVARPL